MPKQKQVQLILPKQQPKLLPSHLMQEIVAPLETALENGDYQRWLQQRGYTDPEIEAKIDSIKKVLRYQFIDEEIVASNPLALQVTPMDKIWAEYERIAPEHKDFAQHWYKYNTDVLEALLLQKINSKGIRLTDDQVNYFMAAYLNMFAKTSPQTNIIDNHLAANRMLDILLDWYTNHVTPRGKLPFNSTADFVKSLTETMVKHGFVVGEDANAIKTFFQQVEQLAKQTDQSLATKKKFPLNEVLQKRWQQQEMQTLMQEFQQRISGTEFATYSAKKLSSTAMNNILALFDGAIGTYLGYLNPAKTSKEFQEQITAWHIANRNEASAKTRFFFANLLKYATIKYNNMLHRLAPRIGEQMLPVHDVWQHTLYTSVVHDMTNHETVKAKTADGKEIDVRRPVELDLDTLNGLGLITGVRYIKQPDGSVVAVADKRMFADPTVRQEIEQLFGQFGELQQKHLPQDFAPENIKATVGDFMKNKVKRFGVFQKQKTTTPATLENKVVSAANEYLQYLQRSKDNILFVNAPDGSTRVYVALTDEALQWINNKGYSDLLLKHPLIEYQGRKYIGTTADYNTMSPDDITRLGKLLDGLLSVHQRGGTLNPTAKDLPTSPAAGDTFAAITSMWRLLTPEAQDALRQWGAFYGSQPVEKIGSLSGNLYRQKVKDILSGEAENLGYVNKAKSPEQVQAGCWITLRLIAKQMLYGNRIGTTIGGFSNAL